MSITANIESIGFEAEGGFNHDEVRRVFQEIDKKGFRSHFERKSDGTVSGMDKEVEGYEYNYWSDELKNLKTFLQILYKNGFRSNNRCGFHIHVRFKKNKKAVSYFSFDRFAKMFMRKYTLDFKENPKYIARKTNHFCSSRGLGDNIKRQMKGNGRRYTAINLFSLDEPQRTIEFRIFPYQESATEAFETISWLIITLEKIFEHELIFEEEFNVLGMVNIENGV